MLQSSSWCYCVPFTASFCQKSGRDCSAGTIWCSASSGGMSFHSQSAWPSWIWSRGSNNSSISCLIEGLPHQSREVWITCLLILGPSFLHRRHLASRSSHRGMEKMDSHQVMFMHPGTGWSICHWFSPMEDLLGRLKLFAKQNCLGSSRIYISNGLNSGCMAWRCMTLSLMWWLSAQVCVLQCQ